MSNKYSILPCYLSYVCGAGISWTSSVNGRFLKDRITFDSLHWEVTSTLIVTLLLTLLLIRPNSNHRLSLSLSSSFVTLAIFPLLFVECQLLGLLHRYVGQPLFFFICSFSNVWPFCFNDRAVAFEKLDACKTDEAFDENSKEIARYLCVAAGIFDYIQANCVPIFRGFEKKYLSLFCYALVSNAHIIFLLLLFRVDPPIAEVTSELYITLSKCVLLWFTCSFSLLLSSNFPSNAFTSMSFLLCYYAACVWQRRNR